MPNGITSFEKYLKYCHMGYIDTEIVWNIPIKIFENSKCIYLSLNTSESFYCNKGKYFNSYTKFMGELFHNPTIHITDEM